MNGEVKEVYYPNREFSKHAYIKNMCEYHDLQNWAKEDFEGFWDHFAKERIDWFEPYEKVLDESGAPFYKWFSGGRLNVSHLCIDRHLQTKKNKAAILFEGERGDVEVLTYGELSTRVNRTANLLKNRFGIEKGDRVLIYMPMIPETAVMMLACVRIGAIHSVVFGGFSSEAIRDRIIDAGARMVITADGAYRRGKPYLLKPAVDKALEQGCETVEKVLVVRRNNETVDMVEGRDLVYNDIVKEESIVCEPEAMESEEPLFLLYTSGSTGKPKGVLHTQAGYILWAEMTTEWVFDVKPNDIYWCTADVGWITGHTYIVYGPLALGATTVIYEGTPLFPDAGRWWRMIEEHRINQIYTAPTAIRMLHKTGAEEPGKYDLSSLKVLGTVGEPIDPDAWHWYHKAVGGGRCPIVDTWWQTETGGQMISPLPGATPLVPGCATLPLPGIMAEIVDAKGDPVPVGEKGLLCITRPWPSMIRGIWNDPDRYRTTYYSECTIKGKPVYFSGDAALNCRNGYIMITGRTDDVINVSGHRIGTAEIESAIAEYEEVAESAVVGRPHEIKGESLLAFVVLKGEGDYDQQGMGKAINETITTEIGPFAKCDGFVFVPGLPKTRSGKVMRRILRSIAKCEAITQDTSTLEDPSVVEEIQKCAEAECRL
jgi:acetyl-CoA synthetase